MPPPGEILKNGICPQVRGRRGPVDQKPCPGVILQILQTSRGTAGRVKQSSVQEASGKMERKAKNICLGAQPASGVYERKALGKGQTLLVFDRVELGVSHLSLQGRL